jgi:hypothetical protein
LRAAARPAVVTMFQPARPPLTWSREAKRRARLYGSLYVVDAVAISPIRLVAAARMASRTVGSSWPAGRNSMPCHSAGPSARNSESSRPRSAICASRTQCWTSTSA